MTNIAQSFIFAAGRGSRMRPFTDTTPKPLANIGEKPILGHIIDKVNQVNSIENIVVNGHYLADQVKNYLKNLNNSKINFSHESEKLETGGGLVFALKNQKFDINQPLLLINGDILWKNDDLDEITNLSNFYQQGNCDIALGLTKTAEYFGYDGNGDFNLQENGDLLKNPQKTARNSHVFAGISIINPKILQFAPSKSFSMGYFYNNLENPQVKIKGLELESKFFHIGDMTSFDAVKDLRAKY